ncbi:MAG: Fe-S cluster assembly protein SufD [Nitriliruptoraceae bacterium]|nr:Fe-S cluster assembly protein SufD [Nitriliruptoraceae bacterium]
MNLDALTEEGIAALSDAAGEPSWLRDRRLAAFKHTLDRGWPNSREDEFWRSTPFDRRIDVDRDLVTTGSGASAPGGIVDGLELEAAQLRIVDGSVVEATVPTALAEQGVVVADLADALTTHGERIEQLLGQLTTADAEGTGADEDKTIGVNDAAFTVGAFVHVPAEVEVAVPIGIHLHVTQPGAHLPRILLDVGHHAAVTVVLEHTSAAGTDALVDEVLEGFVHDGATVRLASVQSWHDEIQHLSLQKLQVHRDADVSTVAVTTGGATVRLRPETDLVGPGAQVRPLGVYFATDGQWFDLQPYVRHIAPHASSDVLFKGALQGDSRSVFRGNVFVDKDAVGTSTDENNKSLILTKGARADATPFLEIHCADITAGHGSATGQIDALHLFYLESRGIRREDALRLIVFGFFREVLREIDIPGIEDAALAAIEARVEAADLSAVQVNDAALRDAVSA